MDDMEDEPRFPPKSHSQNRSKRVPFYSHPLPSNYNPNYPLADDEYEDDGEFDQQSNKNNDIRYLHDLNEQSDNLDRYTKRQKLKNPVSNFEFVPRSGNLVSYKEGNSSNSDWKEHEKFVLLEVWGDRFLQLGRNSLRSEDWVAVSEKVSEALKIDRTEVECKQMMDLLKRRYRKERVKGGGGGKWAYFRKMDMLMSQELGSSSSSGFSLACGVDSGEFVFMDTDVYLERANGNDEMRDSPCDSEEDDEDEEELGVGNGGNVGVKGLRVLADSVQKFGKIYEKIESSKREQMLELERMRSEFQRELELQKKQILDRAQVEIARIREVDSDSESDSDDDDDDDSGEDVTGSQ